MSWMTYLEAIESVLSSELDERLDLIILRPGARRALEESERDIALPRMGKAAFSIAQGAAMTGMHPVLDLRQEKNCTDLLLEAVCDLRLGAPALTVLVSAEEAELLMEIPGFLALYPKTVLEAAGFTRAALRSSRASMLIVDQMLFEEEEEIPDEPDFMLLPPEAMIRQEEMNAETAEEAESEESESVEEIEAEEYAPADDVGEDEAEEATAADNAVEDEAEETPAADAGETEAAEGAADHNAVEAEAEESAAEAGEEPLAEEEEAAEESEEEPEQAKEACAEEQKPEPSAEAGRPVTGKGFCASRMLPCNMARLRALADELDMPCERLADLCMEHVSRQSAEFEWQMDAEAVEGECAFLPPVGKAASVWIGCDCLTVSYDPEQTAHTEAAALLRAVRRMLEKPTLLIYDKEGGNV